MPPYVFFEKQFMPLENAKVGVLTHALHYGTACFEGIRGNWNSEQNRICLFRIQDHYKRMLNGCRLLKMKLPYAVDDLCQLTIELLNKGSFREDVYIRPLAYKSSQAIGVRLHGLEDALLIVATTLGSYLGKDRVRCCTSSWRRVDDTMIPARGKISGIYVNSALAKTEAEENGFDEAILLSNDGHVSEGSGENIFVVINGTLITPPSTDNILLGITRNTVIELAKNELGIDTIERSIDRSELYLADECFFTGTATHIAPIIEIDNRIIDAGDIGKITGDLQKLYKKVITGSNPKYDKWYTFVSP